MVRQKQIEYDEAEDASYLDKPAKVEVLTDSTYQLEPFTPISESATDKETTEADLQHINNLLAVSASVLPNIKTLLGLCALSSSVCKLIETRRKVKKLDYGKPADGKSGKTYEIIE